jgi:uncharacterized protein YjbI with pentapeptide repeats
MSLTFEEARKKISKDELKEGLKLLEQALGEVTMEESVKRGFQNTVVVFLARYNRVQKERSIRTPEYYDMQLNSLATDMLELIDLIEEELGKGMKAVALEINDTKFLTELVVDIDFGEKREAQLEDFLTGLATLIRIKPGSLTVINKKAKSIIVEGILSTEDLLKIKSLVRVGLLEGLESIKGFGVKEEWIKENLGLYLINCQLSHAKIPGADLSKGDLSNADLSWADLSGANLIGAKLMDADLNGVDLNGADLNGADITGADLDRANLDGANLRGAILNKASLIEATLKRANLRWAQLSNADLRKANFHSATLSNAKLSGTDLNGTNLSNANLKHADLDNAMLSGANLTGVDLTGSNLIGSNLSKANLSGAHIVDACLIEADLSGANLNNTNLSNADLTWAVLNGADLSCADLMWAELDGADITGAIFHINQAPILKGMNVNISEVIFVDDNGEKVNSDGG